MSCRLLHLKMTEDDRVSAARSLAGMLLAAGLIYLIAAPASEHKIASLAEPARSYCAVAAGGSVGSALSICQVISWIAAQLRTHLNVSDILCRSDCLY